MITRRTALSLPAALAAGLAASAANATHSPPAQPPLPKFLIDWGGGFWKHERAELVRREATDNIPKAGWNLLVYGCPKLKAEMYVPWEERSDWLILHFETGHKFIGNFIARCGYSDIPEVPVLFYLLEMERFYSQTQVPSPGIYVPAGNAKLTGFAPDNRMVPVDV